MLWTTAPSLARELRGALAVYRHWSAVNDRPVDPELEELAEWIDLEARDGHARSHASTSLAAAGPRTDDAPALLDLEEAAEVLNYSTRTVRRRVSEGELPAIRDGRILRFRLADLEQYVDARRTA